MSAGVRLSRRALLKGGGSLLVAFSLFPKSLRANDTAPPPIVEAYPRVDSWIKITSDETVELYTGKVELGHGLYTSLAQILAEELDVGIGRIRVINADTGRSPVEFPTAGSLSVEQSGHVVRLAAADLRSHLLEWAAVELDVSRSALRVTDGQVSTASGQAITYWTLVGEHDIEIPLTGRATPKAPEEFSEVGQSRPRIDLPAKLTASPVYLVDLRLPDMAHGRIVRPPGPKARLRSLDESGARSTRGVIAIVRDGSFLGVVAEREYQAILAAEALREAAEWEEPDDGLPDQDSLPKFMLEAAADTTLVAERGTGPSKSEHSISATYTRPPLAHGSIGPSIAVAHFDDGQLTIWNHSQHKAWVRQDLAQVLSIPVEAIRLVHMPHAGSYGHNGQDDVMLDAALLAREVGRPVRVMWRREDELSWAPFGTPMVVKVEGNLGPKGVLESYAHDVWSYSHVYQAGRQFLTNQSGTGLLAAQHLASPFAPYPPSDAPSSLGGGADRNAVPIYDIPNVRVRKHVVHDMPIRMSSLRSLGAYANIFALESFMDEAARLAEADPIEFRLRHLSDMRWRELIETVRRRSRWDEGEMRSGEGRGFAFAQYKNRAGAVAMVLNVRIDEANGEITLGRIWAVADVGLAVNPQGVRDQVEGGIIQSLSWSLKERVTFDRRSITSTDWVSYPILRVSEAPTFDIEIINRPHLPSLGAGEIAQGPAVAALANAIHDASGVRLRDLPLTADRIVAALSKRGGGAIPPSNRALPPE